MKFYDIGLAAAGLEKKALSLGYFLAASPARIRAGHKSDLHKLSAGKQQVFSVSSPSGELLRKACGLAGANALLIDAFSVPSFFKDDGLVRSVAEAAKDGKPVGFEIPYAYFLRTSFVYRAKFVFSTRVFLRKCLKLGAPFAITSAARDEFELKSPREVIAIAQLWGLSAEQARSALAAAPEKIFSSVSPEGTP